MLQLLQNYNGRAFTHNRSTSVLVKGMEHLAGSSLEESAVNAENPAIPIGVIELSVPPAIMTSASPY